jgi:hypothetical protein
MKHVIIDGSNIATEGRDAPSLAQLDEAVRAFIDEYAPDVVTVVVDATFPNRIDAKERQTFEDAVDANELITPPAGAIGRGDAFVLQIARKADASILSNDSFQEFHGDYPWLFERGRLIGGKPVPHVGWVFMERTPVRGPASRRSVSDARKVATKATKATRATKTTRATKASKAAAGDVGRAADGEVLPEVEVGEAAEAAPTPTTQRRRSRATKAAAEATTASAALPAVGAGPEPAGAAEAVSGAPASNGDGRGDGRALARPSKGVAPYNEALPFIEFIADHPVGSEVEATVERFSSHGAYVMSGAARGYVPLRNLGDPAPRSARELLRVGESRRFVVVAIDPPRRGIDLALPGVVTPMAAPSPITVGDLAVGPEFDAGVAADGEQADAASASATSRKSTAKRSAGRKAPRRSPAQKTPAEKAATRKAATKKAATKKAVTEKAATETAASNKAAPKASGSAAKKATSSRAPAGRTAANKAAGTKAATTASKRSTAKTAKTARTAKAATAAKAAKKAPAGQ